MSLLCTVGACRDQVESNLVQVIQTNVALVAVERESRRGHARGGVGVASLLGRQFGRAGRAVVVAGVRLVGADGALVA